MPKPFMKTHRATTTIGLLIAGATGLLWGASAFAADLREATFTQVVNSVTVTNAQGSAARPAVVQNKFASPDIIRTGANSRAELTASDQTVTRVGANTIFSFKPEGRGINLQQGSVLFNSPTGRGGGTIQTAAATASVLGTTIIVTTTANGGFKLLVLEGKAQATLPNGREFIVRAGQMTFITPGMTHAPQVFEFRLSKQNEGSGLLNGFTKELPAQQKVIEAVTLQNVQIANGEKNDTGLLIGNVGSNNTVEVIDPSLIQVAVAARDSYADTIQKFKNAVTSDVTASTPLDSGHLVYFSDSTALKLSLEAIGDTESLNDLPKTVWGFGAANLTIPAGTTYDLSPYADAETFAFYGKDSVNIQGSATFSGFPGEVTIRSHNAMSISSYASLSFNSLKASIVANSSSAFSLSILTLTNNGGQMRVSNEGSGGLNIYSTSITGSASSSLAAIAFESNGDMQLYSGNYTTDGAYGCTGLYFDVAGTLSISSVTYSSASLSVQITGGSGGDVYLGSSNNFNVPNFEITGKNNVTANSTNITANNLKMAVVGTINLENGTFTSNNLNLSARNINLGTSTTSVVLASNASGTATLSAGTASNDALNMTNVNLNSGSNFSSISMQAYTINLTSVQFNSSTQYYFKSYNGTYNFGSSANGYINFISGNTINGSPISGLGSLTSNFHASSY